MFTYARQNLLQEGHLKKSALAYLRQAKSYQNETNSIILETSFWESQPIFCKQIQYCIFVLLDA